MQLIMRTKAFIMLSTSYVTFLGLAGVAAQLNPACAPGGNFDLSIWQLEMPTPRPNQPSLPDVITPSRLVGCQGYQNNPYFYTDSKDGAMIIAGGGTAIGQVFHDDPLKPSAELYYLDDGTIQIGVAQTRAGHDQKVTPVGKVPLGQKFSYEIRYENNVLSIRLNDDAFKTLSTYQLNAPKSFFKIGNYLQGNKPSTVRFYSIKVSHSASDPGCSFQRPATKDQFAVTLSLYEDASCCSAPFETTTVGQLSSCRKPSKPFRALTQGVGQNMFGRNIRILGYANDNCSGEPLQVTFLTNAEVCHSSTSGTPYRSFMIVEA
ncbi:concanavalin A-like lectin/glucanase [Sarocladium strictum]